MKKLKGMKSFSSLENKRLTNLKSITGAKSNDRFLIQSAAGGGYSGDTIVHIDNSYAFTVWM